MGKKKKKTKEKDLAYYVTDHFYLGWDSMDKKLRNGIFVYELPRIVLFWNNK